MKINFTKMHGCGNDFIMIDHRDNRLDRIDVKQFIRQACERKYGAGANGLMLLEHSSKADVKMRYFNADGSLAEMCGNGARCMARFAYEQGAAEKNMVLETLDGNYPATVHDNGTVSVYFPGVEKKNIKLSERLKMEEEDTLYHYGWVGVPHTTVFGSKVTELERDAFETWGRNIRQLPIFPKGTNVNLVEVTGPQSMIIRTYERGVEEETLACGSGATASAIFGVMLGRVAAPVDVETMGGMLQVDFKEEDHFLQQITLTGNAVVVYKGELEI